MNIFESDILKMNFKQPDPLAGDLLIAEPLMVDAPFQRSVVVVIDHSEDGGTMGLIINRLSHYNLADLVDDIHAEADIPVFIGGPVHKERMYYLHSLADLIPDSVEVSEGLYVSGSYDVIKDYINAGGDVDGKIRFFLGYSGWDAGQLRGELDKYDWAVNSNADVWKLLQAEEEDAWQMAVRSLDKRYRLWLNCPRSIIMN